MEQVPYKLAFESEKAINFHFQDADIFIGPDATMVDPKYAALIVEQFPGWIEPVPNAAPKKAPATVPTIEK